MANPFLEEARAKNPHVPDYLTGRKSAPSERPTYIVAGDETEAADYAASAAALWARVPGALEWLDFAPTNPRPRGGRLRRLAGRSR